MATPQDPLSDEPVPTELEKPVPTELEKPVPPEVEIKTGTLQSPQLHQLAEAFSPKVHQLVSQGSREAPGAQLLTTTCRKMPLFDPRITRTRQLALWRRQPPKVASPRLPSRRVLVKTLNIPILRTKTKRGRFRPMQVKLHEIEPLPFPNTQSLLEFAKQISWVLLVHSLEAFSAAKQSYYHWYSRERLDLDLTSPSFRGMCCYVPPVELELLGIKAHANASWQLHIQAIGSPRESLEGRHGLVFQDETGLRCIRLPPP